MPSTNTHATTPTPAAAEAAPGQQGGYRSFTGCLMMLLLLGAVIGAMAAITAIVSTAAK